MTAPFLLRGVDLAAFAVALVAKLRNGGVVVSAGGSAGLVAAMRQLVPRTRVELYWAARLTLVNRMEDLTVFDVVFDAVFAHAVPGLVHRHSSGPDRPQPRRHPVGMVTARPPLSTVCRG